MFHKKIDKNGILITFNNFKNIFGPFKNAFVNNNFEKEEFYFEKIEEFLNYKYAIGKGEKFYFIIGKNGLEKLIKI